MLGSIGKALNQITGATNASNAAYSQSKSLANMSYAQQKEFAKNAHQWEMQDLQKAGLNPALTTGASSAGSIAGGGSTGNSGNIGNGNLLDVVGMINNTRLTNANVDKTKTETNMLHQQLDNETTSAKANLINAQANKQNADTQEKLAESGRGGQLFGTENGGLASSILAIAAPFLAGGIGMGAIRGLKGIQALRTSRGFGNFLKSLNSAK